MSTSPPLFDLLQSGDEKTLLQLIEQDPAAANARDSNGVSLLMQAFYRGRRTLAEAIAARKVELDVFEASTLGRLDTLRALLRDRISARAFSADGFTALHFACYFGQPEAARLLLDNGAAADAVARNPMQVMPLHSAASSRNVEAARLLLDRGAPVNARQNGGYTAIHAAAQNGDLAFVELLLEHGADPAISNSDGQTPAMIARSKGHNEVAARLER